MIYYRHVDTRVLILTLPSLVVLGLLVFHSLRTLPRSRAVAFWCSVAAYGLLRGNALRWVIAHGLGAAFPYVIRKPLFPVLGVPLQEIAGWAIVSYIGWWLGCRFSRQLFAQVAWATLFLGMVSWAVESAAVAVGWWHWTVPVSQPLFVNVPFIGIVDWAFVGIDFLLPFAVITAPGFRRRPERFLASSAFPLHFGAHCFVKPPIGGFPIPTYHLIHWLLLAVLLWLAMRSAEVDPAFDDAGEGRTIAMLPLLGLAIVLIIAAAVEVGVVHVPQLLPSLLPAIALAVSTFRPAVGYAVGAAGLVSGAWLASLALAAAPAATAAILTWGRRHRRWAPAAVLAVMGVFAVHVHSAGARDSAALVRRLDAALAARDRGELDAARQGLAALCADFPGAHAPPAFLGEIDYRMERLDEARRRFTAAIEIKQDYKPGYRYLAVIDLRQGRKESAARFAERGLALDGDDLELRYLSARARGEAYPLERFARLAPEKAHGLAALAFEVGDTELARRVVEDWRVRFLEDAEARRLARVLGVE